MNKTLTRYYVEYKNKGQYSSTRKSIYLYSYSCYNTAITLIGTLMADYELITIDQID